MESSNKLKLLPQTHSDFQRKEYWDNLFSGQDASKKRSEQETGAFEWYGTWSDLKRHVESEVPSKDSKVLVVGCGNSSLSEEMYKDGFTDVTSVDFSEVVINEMQTRTKGMTGMSFLVMDMLDMDPTWSDTFDVVFDKGAIDALVAEESEEVLFKGQKMLEEVTRVLKPGGKYLAVTLAQQHILNLFLSAFSASRGFEIHVYPFEPKSGSVLLPFLFCIEKSAASPCQKVFVGDAAPLEISPDQQLSSIIEDRRLVYHMQQKLKQSGKGLLAKFALWGDTNSPRYLVSVVESGLPASQQQLPCGVFLVPKGREYEWTFASEEGQMSVATGNKIGRLIVVSMGRGHEFDSMDAVQAELAPSMVPLIPKEALGPSGEGKVPYLTVGTDLGWREEIATVRSELSGNMVVEDVKVTDEATGKEMQHRRLVFLDSSDVVQSEARLVGKKTQRKSNGGKRKTKGGANKKKQSHVQSSGDVSSSLWSVETRFLAFEFHQAMVAGLFLAGPKKGLTESTRFVVAGLGGGALAGYLAKDLGWFAPSVHVDAVELDPVVVETAEKYFDFNKGSSNKVQVHIGDGAEFLAQIDGERYRAVFVDVDAKDLSQPVLFPPMPFLADQLLVHLRDDVLEEKFGLLVINLSSKSDVRRKEILAQLRTLFTFVFVASMQSIGDSNFIVFALNRRCNEKDDQGVQNSAKKLLEEARGLATVATGNAHDFEDYLRRCLFVCQDGSLVEMF